MAHERRGAPAWPLRFRGAEDMAYDDAVIEQAIDTVIGTQMGERVIRRGFGSLIPHLVFENEGTVREALASVWTRDALRQVSAIEVLDVTAQDSRVEVGITIDYAVRATRRRSQRMVRIPSQGGGEQ